MTWFPYLSRSGACSLSGSADKCVQFPFYTFSQSGGASQPRFSYNNFRNSSFFSGFSAPLEKSSSPVNKGFTAFQPNSYPAAEQKNQKKLKKSFDRIFHVNISVTETKNAIGE